MTLNPQLVGELTRQRMGDPDGSRSARYINLIPQALKAFARKVAADPSLRPWLTTDPNSVSLPISNGKVDLTAGYNDQYFLAEYLDLGQMYLLPAGIVTSVDLGDDTITMDATIAAQLSDLSRVQLASTISLPGPIAEQTDYYLENFTLPGESQLATESDGTGVVNLVSSGNGTIIIIKMDVGFEQAKIELLKSPMQAAFPRRLAGDFQYAYVQGDWLYLLPSSTIGKVAFAVPYQPATLAALPDDEAAERMFLDKLYEIATGPGSDAAEDMQQ